MTWNAYKTAGVVVMAGLSLTGLLWYERNGQWIAARDLAEILSRAVENSRASAYLTSTNPVDVAYFDGNPVVWVLGSGATKITNGIGMYMERGLVYSNLAERCRTMAPLFSAILHAQYSYFWCDAPTNSAANFNHCSAGDTFAFSEDSWNGIKRFGQWQDRDPANESKPSTLGYPGWWRKHVYANTDLVWSSKDVYTNASRFSWEFMRYTKRPFGGSNTFYYSKQAWYETNVFSDIGRTLGKSQWAYVWDNYMDSSIMNTNCAWLVETNEYNGEDLDVLACASIANAAATTWVEGAKADCPVAAYGSTFHNGDMPQVWRAWTWTTFPVTPPYSTVVIVVRGLAWGGRVRLDTYPIYTNLLHTTQFYIEASRPNPLSLIPASASEFDPAGEDFVWSGDTLNRYTNILNYIGETNGYAATPYSRIIGEKNRPVVFSVHMNAENSMGWQVASVAEAVKWQFLSCTNVP